MALPRFFKSATLFPKYVEAFYRARPELRRADYATQYAALMHDSFFWGDVWKRAFEGSGLWQATEVLANVEPLQRAWAREHGLRVGEDWAREVLRAQLLEARPEAWFQEGFRVVTPEFRAEIRRALPGLRMALTYDGIGWHDAGAAGGCDIVITCLDETAAFYSAQGFGTVVIQHGFDPSVNDKLVRRAPLVDVGFAGSVLLGRRPHHQRRRVLAAVGRALPVEYHLMLPPRWHLLGNRFLAARQGAWRDVLFGTARLVGEDRTLRRLDRGGVYGLAMFQSLADARISLNIHIDAAGDRAVNMRLFEATGVGSCLLTDRKQGLEELFEVGKEVVVFDGPEDCVEKARWLLAHEGERAAIARAGQARTLRDHNLDTELRDVARTLAGRLG